MKEGVREQCLQCLVMNKEQRNHLWGRYTIVRSLDQASRDLAPGAFHTPLTLLFWMPELSAYQILVVHYEHNKFVSLFARMFLMLFGQVAGIKRMMALFAEKTLSEAFDVVRSMRHELHDWISLVLLCSSW